MSVSLIKAALCGFMLIAGASGFGCSPTPASLAGSDTTPADDAKVGGFQREKELPGVEFEQLPAPAPADDSQEELVAFPDQATAPWIVEDTAKYGNFEAELAGLREQYRIEYTAALQDLALEYQQKFENLEPRTEEAVEALRQEFFQHPRMQLANALKKRQQELGRVGRSRMLKAIKRFSISGTIVDDSGDRVPEVSLTVAKVWYPNGGTRTEEQTTDMTIDDGRFEFVVDFTSLDCQRIGEIELRFEKDGYHKPLDGSLRLAIPDERYAQLVKESQRAELPTIDVDFHDLEIILYKRGTPVKLEGFTGKLVYRADGSGEAMEIVQAAEEKLTFKITEFADIDNANDQLASGVYFISNADEAASRESAETPKPTSAAERGPKLPEGFRLIMCDPDPSSGFWPIRSDKDGKYNQDPLMRQAPADGYKREISAADFSHKAYGAFYFKINGLYGKGGINNSEYPPAGEYSMQIGLALQPDGSRNTNNGR